MQALTHCGSEFLTLSVEEPEDIIRSFNTLSSPVLSQSTPADKRNRPSLTISGGSCNPFNLVNVTGASSMTMISEPMSHLLTLPFLERYAGRRTGISEYSAQPRQNPTGLVTRPSTFEPCRQNEGTFAAHQEAPKKQRGTYKTRTQLSYSPSCPRN